MLELTLVTGEQEALCAPDNCNPDYVNGDCYPNDTSICSPYKDD